MKPWLGILMATLALSLASPGAQAAPIAPGLSTRLEELNQRFAAVDKAVAGRTALLGRLDRYRRSIRDTRRQEAGPARDFKLRRLLAEAQALAKQISALDVELARHQEALEEARQSLLRLLAELQGAQREKVQQELARTRQSKDGRPAVLKVARPLIHPLDGPREIEEKADVLRDSEDKIRKRIEEIDRALTNMAERRRLRSISQRLDRYTGIFNEDSSSRRVTRIRPSKIVAPAEGAPNPAGEMDTQGGYAPADDFAGSGVGRTVTSGTYAVVLRELLTPATLHALRKAGESGDPEARIRALRKAREELQKAAADLRSRSQTYRERARQLRTHEKR